MLKCLNNPTFDNERNILNADLFVSNLKNTLKAFNIHTKVIFSITDNLTDYCFKITYPDEFTELYSEAYLGVK